MLVPQAFQQLLGLLECSAKAQAVQGVPKLM